MSAVVASNAAPSLVQSGLTSRGGLSNCVLFFDPEGIVVVDVGIGPALRAGAMAGALGGLVNIHSYGPQVPDDIERWRVELERKAKRVSRFAHADLEAITLRLQMWANELVLSPVGGKKISFTLMNRSDTPHLLAALEQRFSNGFSVQMSAMYGFLSKHAPVLVS